MSGDPERLLSVGQLDPLERELLGSVKYVGPPEGAKDDAWRAIAGQIAIVAAVGAATGSSAAAATKTGVGSLVSWALSTKVVAALAVSGLTAGAGYLALREPPAPAASSKLAPALAPPPAARTKGAPVLSPPEQSQSAPIATTEDAPSRRLEPRRPDLLKQESELLTQARAQLRSGNPAGAQASLDRLQSQFPKGMLAQEREVLSIEVLSARGNVEGARRRARAFVKAYPHSPHSAKLARFIE